MKSENAEKSPLPFPCRFCGSSFWPFNPYACLFLLNAEPKSLAPDEFRLALRFLFEAVALGISSQVNDLSRHLGAAEGYIELVMFVEAADELECIAPEDQASPEVLALRVVIYKALEQWNPPDWMSGYQSPAGGACCRSNSRILWPDSFLSFLSAAISASVR
jgi:hypothetical protein